MDTKYCPKCNNTKPTEEFSWKDRAKGKRFYCCKDCWNKRNRADYKRNAQRHITRIANRQAATRRWLRQYKAEHGCSRCPENDPACLQFHHTDQSKEYELSSDKAISMSLTRLLREIAKCDILCANCHAKHHYRPASVPEQHGSLRSCSTTFDSSAGYS